MAELHLRLDRKARKWASKIYLIEGVSGSGNTAVCKELQRRGYHAINGDRELAYLGDPETGEPADDLTHEPSAIFRSEHHIWDVEKVKALVANPDEAVTFFLRQLEEFFKIHRFV